MHEPECRDGIEWWPESAPTPIDVSTLPASGAISTPKRLPGSGQWVGLWGDFAGARIAYSATESFAVGTGAVFPYPTRPDDPEGVDLYFSKDTGASGTMSIGRFKTMAAARAWVGLQISLRSPGGGGLGPFPAASALSDTDPNPTTTRVGANGLVWDILNAQWVRWEARAPSDALPQRTPPVVLAEGALFDSVNNVWVRQRQIASAAATGRAAMEDSFKSIRVNSGTINCNAASTTTLYTVPAGKIFKLNWFCIYALTATTAGAGSALQCLAAALTASIIPTPTIAANNNILNAAGIGATLIAGDTVQLGVVAATGAGTVQMTIYGEERYAE